MPEWRYIPLAQLKPVTEFDFFEPIVRKIKDWHTHEPLKPENAYREDGVTMYYTHPIGVSNITRKWGFNQVVPMACLMHDVFEDTKVIEKRAFTELKDHYMATQIIEVIKIVREVTKIDWDYIKDYTGEKKPRRATRKAAELWRLGSVMDTRPLIVKAADRIHNLMTLDQFEPSFQKKYKAESIDLLHLIKDRLGLLYDMYKDILGVYTPEYKVALLACVNDIDMQLFELAS